MIYGPDGKVAGLQFHREAFEMVARGLPDAPVVHTPRVILTDDRGNPLPVTFEGYRIGRIGDVVTVRMPRSFVAGMKDAIPEAPTVKDACAEIAERGPSVRLLKDWDIQKGEG